MVAGDLVNTASRLQSVAQPGRCWWERPPIATSNAISYEPAGERALKGKTAPSRRGGRRRGRPPAAAAAGQARWSRRSSVARTSCSS